MAHRAISPPPLKRRRVHPTSSSGNPVDIVPQEQTDLIPDERVATSPFQLTQIYELPKECNVDTVTLPSLMEDGPFRSVWHFNFLFDLDFVIAALDEHDRATTAVHIVYGSWRADDGNRRRLESAAKKYPNVKLITAYMPEAFGTHHSKMMILFRDDGTAQVIIHTANMIPFDWYNMTQGAWMSPRLNKSASIKQRNSDPAPIGSGERFKIDLLRYLQAYEPKRTGTLVSELSQYDFSPVRGALIASVPSKDPLKRPEYLHHTPWGQQGLKQVVESLPKASAEDRKPHVVAQVSSIASLRRPSSWLADFVSTMHGQKLLDWKDRTSIIFPSPDEIRNSLNGYVSGSSIHMRVESEGQRQQVDSLRPMLCHWSNETAALDARRNRASPHIKTYIRFADSQFERIEYALLTSANLSQQAWGVPTKDGNLRISSYEIGVLSWPGLFDGSDYSQGHTNDGPTTAIMVPVFAKDKPTPKTNQLHQSTNRLVGLRMPYSLPLRRYEKHETPWSPNSSYTEPDINGRLHTR